MHKIKHALAALVAVLALLVLVGAPSAHAAEPVVVTSITAPQQVDRCGPDIVEGGSPNDYIGPSWDHWKITKTAGVSASLIWYTDTTKNDGYTYTVRYDPKPGYVIADGVQRVWRFPAFSNELCAVPIARAEYAPQVVDGELVIPDVEGVIYTVIDQGTYWRIEATPKPGYVLLAEGLPVVWERAKA